MKKFKIVFFSLGTLLWLIQAGALFFVDGYQLSWINQVLGATAIGTYMLTCLIEASDE